METQLTAAERRTLGNILARGGCLDLTQGRNRPGSIRKSVVRTLIAKGLIRGETLAAAYLHAGTWYPETVYYATAAGCVAFGPEVARVS